jgi:competence protein ComGF
MYVYRAYMILECVLAEASVLYFLSSKPLQQSSRNAQQWQFFCFVVVVTAVGLAEAKVSES